MVSPFHRVYPFGLHVNVIVSERFYPASRELLRQNVSIVVGARSTAPFMPVTPLERLQEVAKMFTAMLLVVRERFNILRILRPPVSTVAELMVSASHDAG
jgi:hypothetical protein